MRGGFILINHDLKLIYIPILKNTTIETTGILSIFYSFKRFTEIDCLMTDNIEEVKTFETKIKKLIIYIKNKYSDYKIFSCSRNPYLRFISAIKYLSKSNKSNIKNILKFNDIFNNNQINSSLYLFDKNHFHKQHFILKHCDFIIDINNYHENFIQMLLKLNIQLKHQKILINDIKLNNSKPLEINIDEDLLHKINSYYKEDFNFLNLKIYDNITELNEFLKIQNKEDTDFIYNKYKNYFIDDQSIINLLIEELIKKNEYFDSNEDENYMTEEEFEILNDENLF